MNASLWLGALVSLTGVAFGGAISFILNRQQLKDAKAQRFEDEMRINKRRSEDRRFAAYSDFFTRARSYRDALPSVKAVEESQFPLEEIDALANSTSTASALVFMVVESEMTYEACRAVIASLKKIQFALHSPDTSRIMIRRRIDPVKEIAQLLREFQVAARDELGVSGVNRSVVLQRGRRAEKN